MGSISRGEMESSIWNRQAAAGQYDRAQQGLMARASSQDKVALRQRGPVVRRVRYGEARADRVAGAQQGAEVGVVGDPERRDDEMVPAAVPGGAALAAQVARPLCRRATARAAAEGPP